MTAKLYRTNLILIYLYVRIYRRRYCTRQEIFCRTISKRLRWNTFLIPNLLPIIRSASSYLSHYHSLNMYYPEFPDWMDTNLFVRIPEISCYNNNYYSHEWKLLFWASDDDYTTDWYLVIHRNFFYLWQSYITLDDRPSDILNRMESMPT